MRTGATFTEQLGQGLADILNPLRPVIGDVIQPWQQAGQAAVDVGQAAKTTQMVMWIGIGLLGVLVVSQLMKR